MTLKAQFTKEKILKVQKAILDSYTHGPAQVKAANVFDLQNSMLWEDA